MMDEWLVKDTLKTKATWPMRSRLSVYMNLHVFAYIHVFLRCPQKLEVRAGSNVTAELSVCQCSSYKVRKS